MQIVRTEVARAIAPSGEAILRVLFCGEGDDCVTVDMTRVDAATDEAAIDRARSILVQTGSFGLAANECDAQSNGNFDEVGINAAYSEKGEVYIFEYRDGEGSRQVPPARMPSFKAAQEEAIRCAIDLLADFEPGTDPLAGWLVRVRDKSGELLCAIDVRQAEAAARQLKP